MRFNGYPRTALIIALAASGFHTGAAAAETSVARTDHFALHSDPRMSLHHFLYMWVTGEESERVTRPHATPMPSKAMIEELTTAERALWDSALLHYRRAIAGRSLLFDRNLIAFKRWICEGGELSPANQTLLRQLESVEALYARVWWPAHDARNRVWVREVLPHVRRVERELCPLLAEIFGGTWPAGAVRVDLVPHSNDRAGYTTSEPHVTISTAPADTHLPTSLELLFHEPCHGDTVQGAIERAVAAAERRTGLKGPHDLWHVLLFQTAGQLVQDYWIANGESEYRRMIDVIVPRVQRWRAPLAAIDRHWTPVIRARGAGREEALDNILRAIAGAPARDSAPTADSAR